MYATQYRMMLLGMELWDAWGDTVDIIMLIFKVQVGRANSNSKANMEYIYDQMILLQPLFPDLCVNTKYGFNQSERNIFLMLYMERKSKLNEKPVLT